MSKHVRTTADVFRLATHELCNSFEKLFPLFGQILIACLKCSSASFLPSSYSKKMRWGQVCFLTPP